MKILVTENQLKGVIKEMAVSAYHGTPHNFDNFDVNKVGSGESSQWFGWGLYFTDDEGIADWYSKSVSDQINKNNQNKYKVYFRGNLVGRDGRPGKYTGQIRPVIDSFTFKRLAFGNDYNIIEDYYDFIQRHYIQDIESILYYKRNNKSYRWKQINGNDFDEYVNSELKKYNPEDLPYEFRDKDRLIVVKNKIISVLSNISESDWEYRPEEPITKSYKYNVTLHKGKTPEQYDYMSWYDGLTETQKSKIINQIKTEKLKNRIFYVVKPEDSETEIQPKFFHDYRTAKEYQSRAKTYIPLLGITVNQHVVEKQKFDIKLDLNGEVKEFYIKLSGLLGSPKEASLLLLRSGIDGIKYPSNTIAGGESKGFNYVVFDSNSVQIDKKEDRELK
jgi:hypothetical protein